MAKIRSSLFAKWVSFSSMIHPTAIIDPAATLGRGVSVGPYAIIEGPANIGDGGQVAAAAHIIGDVSFGANCYVGNCAVIGAPPQDLSFDLNTNSSITIGKNNTFREHVTVHRSATQGGSTSIGDGNFLMVASHIGHDCIVGDNNVLANAVLVAGHVTIGDSCFLGGGAGFHQFIRIGSRCMVKGNAQISQDVPPFTVVHGQNALAGLNVIGLRRAGYSAEERADLKRLYFKTFRSQTTFSNSIAEAKAQPWNSAAEQLLEFVDAPSKKGLCSYRQ